MSQGASKVREDGREVRLYRRAGKVDWQTELATEGEMEVIKDLGLDELEPEVA